MTLVSGLKPRQGGPLSHLSCFILLLLSLSTLIATAPHAYALSIIAFVPLTITNNQSTATPNPFQQQITFNPSLYAAFEKSDLGNIRFCADTACGTEYNAWLESCTASCDTSATSAVAWVKLTNSIPGGGGTATVYMVFLTKTTGFDGNFWGEAPVLSGTYGEFDNGANVFTFYDNFAGSSLSSKWSTPVTGCSGTPCGTFSDTVNNGLTLSGTSGQTTQNQAIHVYTAAKYSPGIEETDITSISLPSSNCLTSTPCSMELSYDTIAPTGGTGLPDAGYATDYRFDMFKAPATARIVEEVSGAGSLAAGSSTPSITIGPGILGGGWPATGTQVHYLNYNQETSGTDLALTWGNSYIDLALESATTTGASGATVNWARLRAYPPAGIIPSVTLGATTSTTATTVIPEYPLGLAVLALFMVLAYGAIRRKTKQD